MKVLIVEDDTEHIQSYYDCITFLQYHVELIEANGLKQAIEFIKSVQPDIILLDLELHESDGDGILFLQKLKDMRLKIVPYIIIITHNRSRFTHHIARNIGADYIFTKAKPDYSPRLVLDFANTYFKNRPKPTKEQNNLETIITREVEKIGFTSDMSGMKYLIQAVLAVLYLKKDDITLSTEVYPVIAKKYNKGDWCIDRGIRNAIIKTWRITSTEDLIKNFTANINYGTGNPTSKEMIFYIADKVKNEYAEYI